MPHGKPVSAYFSNPNVDKPMDQIFADHNATTAEIFPIDQNEWGSPAWTTVWVVLPPLRYRGKVLKGLILSRGTEAIAQAIPMVKELFLLGATSATSSLPWSKNADVYFGLYDNPEREAWHR